MGYDIARVISKVGDEFLCSICTKVLENPMQSPCEHTFCNDCIKDWLRVHASCPVDSSLLALDDIKPTLQHFCNLLGKFEIRCNFESKGCETIVPLEQLQHHLTECAFNPNTEVICGKGIQLREKITKLIDEVNQQRDEITKLNMKLQECCTHQSCYRAELLPSVAMPRIIDLDVVCVNEIFKFMKPLDFCTLRQSCTQLQASVDDHLRSLFTHREKWLDLTAHNVGTVNRILQNFGKHVRHLKVREEECGQNLLLNVILTNCSANLKGLSLRNLALYEIDMEQDTGLFNNLEALELISCEGNRKCMELFLLGHQYPNLTTLRIADLAHTDVIEKFFMRKRKIK